MLTLHYLNHASVLIEINEIRLLIDPWYQGTCFEEGWGLRYQNEAAFDLAQTATHLWISHFHADHFHVPTLKRVLALNPDIQVLGNHSFNFQLDEALKGIGFQHIIPIYERKPIQLTDQIRLTRYPTTGIDNMLHIESDQGTVLNYNDCNLPPLARKMISKKIKSVDILMTNFNHAGKLLVYPYPGDAEIKKRLKRSFHNNYHFFDTKYIFPFASHHYYRAPESMDQNGSMLVSQDLLDLDPRILDIEIGDSLVFDQETGGINLQKGNNLPQEPESLTRESSYPLEQLTQVGRLYSKTLRENYGLFCRLLPPFYIEVSDLNILTQLHPRKGLLALPADTSAQAHIRVHSSSLHKWFSQTYGTDSFVVGAHFEVAHDNKIPLKWQVVFGLLIDNKLSVRSILQMLFSLEGIRFLWHRREEILGILWNRRLSAEYHD